MGLGTKADRLPKRYALCPAIRYNIRGTYGHDYPQAGRRDIEIHPFYGAEKEQQANRWILKYEQWALQEHLNCRQKLQLVLTGMFDEAYVWTRDLELEKGRWKEFRHLFRERYVGDPTPWTGSAKFPYWLYFNGVARSIPGQTEGIAGIGAVLVSPLKELEIATISQYLGKHCSVHVAEYTALILGLDSALRRGVRHLTIMGDSLHVFNQVIGKWQCHSSDRELKNNVCQLLNNFRTCGVIFIPQKYNAEAQALANRALDHSECPRQDMGYDHGHCPHYKTHFCKDWAAGYCRYGTRCHRAHGHNELRT